MDNKHYTSFILNCVLLQEERKKQLLAAGPSLSYQQREKIIKKISEAGIQISKNKINKLQQFIQASKNFIERKLPLFMRKREKLANQKELKNAECLLDHL